MGSGVWLPPDLRAQLGLRGVARLRALGLDLLGQLLELAERQLEELRALRREAELQRELLERLASHERTQYS